MLTNPEIRKLISDMAAFVRAKGQNVRLHRFEDSVGVTDIAAIPHITVNDGDYDYFFTLVDEQSRKELESKKVWEFIHGATGCVLTSNLGPDTEFEKVYEFFLTCIAHEE